MQAARKTASLSTRSHELSYESSSAHPRRERITIDRATWKVERQLALPGQLAARWGQYGPLAPLVTCNASGALSSRAGAGWGLGALRVYFCGCMCLCMCV